MSVKRDVADKIGGLCVGAAALAVGDPSGGTLAATSVTALGAIGFTLNAGAANRAARKAEKRILQSAEKHPELTDNDIEKARELLDDVPRDALIDPRRLAERAKDVSIEAAVLEDLLAALGLSNTQNGTRTVIEHAFLAGFREVYADESFKRSLTLEAVLALTREFSSLHGRIENLIREGRREARQFGVKEGMLIALAVRYAEGDHSDFDSAYRGLERALEVAAERPAPSNLSAEVNDIVAEVARRTEEESPDAGMDALKAALEEHEAAKLKLLDTGVRQAILTRSVPDAAGFVIAKMEAETPDPAARFKALRAVFNEWWERGRDKGLAFDLEISIALARTCTDYAKGSDERGRVLNDLGIALGTLGERESGPDRLEEAVAAFRDALEEWTRDSLPLDWAMTQNNLGNALRILGARESGTDRLEQAVAAYREALKEYTRDRVPLDWAMTQDNLGTALRTLGERESGTDRLEQAVAAYRDALKERTRDRVPLDWAMTQNNLGIALRNLGARESGTIALAMLEQAVAAYRGALKELTRDRVPLDWATTQNNVGAALSTLGARESGTDRLEEAVAAYHDALKEWTRDRVPLDWAFTQENLSLVFVSFAEKAEGTARCDHLRTALNYVEASLEIFSPADTPFNHDKATRLRDRILQQIAEHCS